MNFKILVADDEYYARKALVMMLEKSELPISVNGDFEDGEEIMNDVDFPSDCLKDSTIITPVGICLSYYEQNNNFIYVIFN